MTTSISLLCHHRPYNLSELDSCGSCHSMQSHLNLIRWRDLYVQRSQWPPLEWHDASILEPLTFSLAGWEIHFHLTYALTGRHRIPKQPASWLFTSRLNHSRSTISHLAEYSSQSMANSPIAIRRPLGAPLRYVARPLLSRACKSKTHSHEKTYHVQAIDSHLLALSPCSENQHCS